MTSIYFQFMWSYFEMIFLLNLEEFSRLGRVSNDINLLSIDFTFKPRRNLKISEDFNGCQSTFNSFSF
jgi:hypothetical protein